MFDIVNSVIIDNVVFIEIKELPSQIKYYAKVFEDDLENLTCVQLNDIINSHLQNSLKDYSFGYEYVSYHKVIMMVIGSNVFESIYFEDETYYEDEKPFNTTSLNEKTNNNKIQSVKLDSKLELNSESSDNKFIKEQKAINKKLLEINKLNQEITQLKQELYQLKNNSISNEIILGSWLTCETNTKLELIKPPQIQIIKFNSNVKSVVLPESCIGINLHGYSGYGILDCKKLELFPVLESLTISYLQFFKNINLNSADKRCNYMPNVDTKPIYEFGFNGSLDSLSIHKVDAIKKISNFDYLNLPTLSHLCIRGWCRGHELNFLAQPYPNLEKITFYFDQYDFPSNLNQTYSKSDANCTHIIFYPKTFYFVEPEDANKEYSKWFKIWWPKLSSIVYNCEIDIDVITKTPFSNPDKNYIEKLNNIRANIRVFKSIVTSYYGNLGLMTTFNICEVASDQYKGLVQKWD